VPDAGAADDPGGDVSERREDAQRGGDPADHGAPGLLRPHRGQERLLLVPEPQGSRAPAAPPPPLRPAPAAVRSAAAAAGHCISAGFEP